MAINAVMKTFINPYKAGCVSQANPVFASSAHEKKHGANFKNLTLQSAKF